MRVMTLSGLKERVQRMWRELKECFISIWINMNKYFNALINLSKKMWQKKWFRVLCYVILTILVIYILFCLMSLVAQASEGDTTPVGGVVTIDAGHGIDTAGKRTPDGIREWTLNDAIADVIEQVLNDNGVETIRVDDPTGVSDIPLIERSNQINGINPSLHLSIHHNALTDGQWGEWGGTETFVKSPNNEANSLAKEIANSISNLTGMKNRGAKYDSLHMTREVRVPSVLVEVGFMDSTTDYQIITDSTQQERIGEAIANEVLNWLNCGL